MAMIQLRWNTNQSRQCIQLGNCLRSRDDGFLLSGAAGVVSKEKLEPIAFIVPV